MLSPDQVKIRHVSPCPQGTARVHQNVGFRQIVDVLLVRRGMNLAAIRIYVEQPYAIISVPLWLAAE